MFIGSDEAPEIIAKFYGKEIVKNPSCASDRGKVKKQGVV